MPKIPGGRAEDGMRRIAALITAVLLLPAGSASALTSTIDAIVDDTLDGDSEPLLLEWSELLPGLTPGHEPSSSNDCKKGHVNCLKSIIREMERRFNRHGCEHNSLFALAYLRTTEEYLRAWHEPGFFEDPAFLNHYDAVFATYYFDAENAWRKERFDRVDPAWQVALAAADAREVTSSGNLLLGMNAHINNDLPFTLADIGLVAPDGTSRKADHDAVNRFLNRVTIPLRVEIVERLDPSFGDSDVPGTFDESATMQMIIAWREAAWRNAERLVNAPSEAHRAAVAAEIKAGAGLVAETIRAATAYGPLRDSADRDAHCAVSF
jgi:hypothetical protein